MLKWFRRKPRLNLPLLDALENQLSTFTAGIENDLIVPGVRREIKDGLTRLLHVLDQVRAEAVDLRNRVEAIEKGGKPWRFPAGVDRNSLHHEAGLLVMRLVREVGGFWKRWNAHFSISPDDE